MSNDFVKFIQDELSGYYKFTYKKMFGEHCLFYGDKIIAIITDDDEIFVKVDEETRHEFVQAGGHPYTYVAQGKQRVMHYMSVPSEVTSAVNNGEKHLVDFIRQPDGKSLGILGQVT